jgi:hypothetical protein
VQETNETNNAGSGNLTVVNGPIPKIVSLQIISNDVQVSFTTLSGYNYRAERATNLVPAIEWTPVAGATNVAGNNGIVAITNSSAANSAEFYYRVVRLP